MRSNDHLGFGATRSPSDQGPRKLSLIVAALLVVLALGLALAFRHGLQPKIRVSWTDVTLDLPILNSIVALAAAELLGQKLVAVVRWRIFWRYFVAWFFTWLMFATTLYLASHSTDGLWLRMWVPFAAVAAALLAACLSWSNRSRRKPSSGKRPD